MDKAWAWSLLVVLCVRPHPAWAQDRAALGVKINDAGGVATVSYVFPNSPAAKAGIAVGDRIVAIDGQPVASYADVSRVISSRSPDAPAPCEVLRETQRLVVTPMLGRANSVLQEPRTVVVPAAPTVRYHQPATRPTSRPFVRNFFNRPDQSGPFIPPPPIPPTIPDIPPPAPAAW